MSALLEKQSAIGSVYIIYYSMASFYDYFPDPHIAVRAGARRTEPVRTIGQHASMAMATGKMVSLWIEIFTFLSSKKERPDRPWLAIHWPSWPHGMILSFPSHHTHAHINLGKSQKMSRVPASKKKKHGSSAWVERDQRISNPSGPKSHSATLSSPP